MKKQSNPPPKNTKIPAPPPPPPRPKIIMPEKFNDISFIENLAKTLNCLPSYFVGDNYHIINAVKKMISDNEKMTKAINKIIVKSNCKIAKKIAVKAAEG
jgi:hypothetical protein